MKLIVTILTIALLTTSCAYHGGIMTGNASLSNNNFKIIGVAKGVASTTKIIGMGGLDKQSLVYEAKKDLYKNFPLKPGQALANISVDFSDAFYFILNKTTVTIHAEVVDYNNDSRLKPSYALSYKGFKVGQNVYYTSLNNVFYQGEILSISDTKILINQIGGPLEIKLSRVFKLSGSTLISGENVTIGTIIKFSTTDYVKLIGYNKDFVLISRSGDHAVYSKKEIKIN